MAEKFVMRFQHCRINDSDQIIKFIIFQMYFSITKLLLRDKTCVYLFMHWVCLFLCVVF